MLALLLVAPVVACVVQVGPPQTAQNEPTVGAGRRGRTTATPAPAPSETPCVEKGLPPRPWDPNPIVRRNEFDSYCCSGRTDENGNCMGWPGKACTEDSECHWDGMLATNKRTCESGHCCLGFGDYCDNGSCCAGLQCLPRPGHPMWPTSHACGQSAPKQLGEACTHHYDCQSQVCRKGKCFAACIDENQPCGDMQDFNDGRGCCEGQRCSRLDKHPKNPSEAWVALPPGTKGICPAIGHVSGCTPAGIVCDPYAKGGPGSVMNNCCGHCDLVDHHCH